MSFNRHQYPQVVHLHLQHSITKHVYNGRVTHAKNEISLLQPVEIASFKADLQHLLHLLEETHPEKGNR